MANQIAEAAETVRDYTANAASNAREYAGQAAHAIEQRSQQAVDSVRQGYKDAESTVRSRPGESVALFFVAGVVAGALLALAFRGKQGWM